MQKHLLIIIACLGVAFSSQAQQNIDLFERLNVREDIAILEKRINHLMQKNPKLKHIKGTRQYHQLLLSCNLYKKEDFYNGAFLSELKPSYVNINPKSIFKKKKRYIQTITLITDSLGNIIARGNALLVNSYNRQAAYPNEDIILSQKFFNKEIEYIFHLDAPFSGNYAIGIRGNDLYGIKGTKDGVNIYDWADFMKNHFDECISDIMVKILIKTGDLKK